MAKMTLQPKKRKDNLHRQHTEMLFKKWLLKKLKVTDKRYLKSVDILFFSCYNFTLT